MKVFINADYYDFSEYKKNMFIEFKEKIITVGEMSSYIDKGYEEIDVKNRLIMPGLVNGHSHIYSMFARGMNVEFNPSNFKELLEQLWWKLDRNITNVITYYSGITAGINYVKNGVTTLIDHHASGEIKGSLEALKSSLREVGLRGIYCFETSDRFDVEQCIDENINFINDNHTNMERGLFGMHAAFTLSDESLEKIASANNNPIHIHIAESKLDQDLSVSNHNMRVIERLDKYNLIKKNSILTHCLYLEDSEMDIIKNREAVIALNISSNMNNGVGLPSYKEMKRKGIKVIIGNDGISQNMTSEYHSLYYSMHHKEESPLGFSLEDLKKIIDDTYDYAGNILDVKLGKIKAGYCADLVILDYNSPTSVSQNNILSHLFFGLFHDFKPSEVYIDGKHILKNKQVNKDVNKLYKKAPIYADILWSSIAKEGKL